MCCYFKTSMQNYVNYLSVGYLVRTVLRESVTVAV